MNYRRPKPTTSKPMKLEMEVTRNENSSNGNTIFCCVARDKRIVYSYSHNKKDTTTMKPLAELCLEHTPQNHRWFTHTVGTRTIGFLMDDGCTYFAIVDPSSGNSETLRFLEKFRDVFNTAVPERALNDALAPVVQQLIATLHNVPRTSAAAIAVFHGESTGEDSPGQKWTTPLIARGNKKRDKGVRNEAHTDGGMAVDDAPPNGRGALPLDRSLSASQLRPQASGRRSWVRQAKIVIAANVVLCVVLFCVWLAVCRGFQCVSS